jgi:GT2 family glycosyltransferase
VGILASRGEYILVLNSDMIFIGNTGKALTDFLAGAPGDVAVIGPLILNLDGTLAPSARRTRLSGPLHILSIINRHFPFRPYLPEAQMRRHLGRLLGRMHDNYADHEQVRETGYIDGMCALMRRAALAEVGLFDEQYFFDSEIIDLAIRLRAAGWRLMFYPGAQAVHLGHASRKKVSHIIVETHRSELIQASKHRPGDLALIRVTGWLVVGLRLALTQATMLVPGPNRARRAEEAAVYREILALYRTFSAEQARSGERIPRLDATPAVRSPRLGHRSPVP